MSGERRKPWVFALEAGGTLAFAAVLGLLASRLIEQITGLQAALVALAAVPLGYFFADIGSGTAHWFCDTFFEEDTPVIGALLIFPFRDHHRDALGITRHGFLELNGNACLATLPLAAASLLLDPALGLWAVFLSSFLTCLFAGAVATNQFHRWAHEPDPPRIARALQRCGLILGTAHHDRHHTPPHAQYYCVTNGWANALLEKIRFFQGFERVLVAIGFPKSKAEEPAAVAKADERAEAPTLVA